MSEYLGDGIYADFDGYQIVLYANDPFHPTDTIYIDPQVFEALNNFAEKVWSWKEEERDE